MEERVFRTAPFFGHHPLKYGRQLALSYSHELRLKETLQICVVCLCSTAIS